MSSSLYSGVSGLALGAGLYGNVSGLWGGASGLVDGLNGSAYPGASLYLNFLSMTAPTFDSRITFSRGSNATVVDNTGRVTYAPANMLTWSEQFDNAAWVKNATGTLLRNETDPLGVANSATTLVADNAGGVAQVYAQQSFSTQAGVTYAMSVYLKQGTQRYAAINIFTGFSNAALWFDLQAGTSGVISGSGATTAISSIGSGWYRCTVVSTATTTLGNATFRIAVADDTTDINYLTPRNGTSSILIWGAQLEQVTYQTTPSAYVATTSAAYYGPRFDHDPVTLAPRGLLVEEARTNSFTQSGNLTSFSVLPATGLTFATNATTAPDGTLTASKITNTATTEQHRLFQTVTLAAATAYTFSVYVKNDTAGWCQISFFLGAGTTAFANINLATGALGATGNGTAYSVTSAGNGWYRLQLTATTDNTGCNCQIYALEADSGGPNPTTTGTVKGLYIWGAQLEAGSFATSYIPTVASTVTRNADVASMTGTNFSSWYNQSEGTFVADAARGGANVAAYMLAASDNTAAEWMGINFATSQRAAASMVDGGAAQFSIATPADVAPINTVTKAAFTYKLNDSNLAVNGLAFTTDTSCTIPTTNRLYIGADVNGAGFFLNGHIRELAYFNTRQSNTRLQTLTAPPLVTTLSLDFTSGTYLVGY